MLRRKALYGLQKWSERPDHKPLVIRGARQVGKTSLVHEFSKTYAHYAYYNLENPIHKTLFETSNSAEKLVTRILLEHDIPKDNLAQTLLFIDEIQASPKAIQYLRFFYEDYPTLHVIATGSLLEHALRANISMPVGRVEYMVLHPINFEEFLIAKNNNSLIAAFREITIPEYANDFLLNLFYEFLFIGGMPEATAYAIKDPDDFRGLNRIYESLIQGYVEDMEKYASNNPERQVMRHILQQIPSHIHRRITFQKFGNSNYKSREVGEAMRSLHLARLIEIIYPISQTEIPVRTNNKRRPKLHFIDSGLAIHLLGIKPHHTQFEKFSADFRGKILEQFVFQEAKSAEPSPLFNSMFWVREKADAMAEVDMVYQYENLLIPVEIKSGPAGKLRSLHEYMDRANHSFAIRFYRGKFHIQEIETIKGTSYFLLNLPFYLACRLKVYIEWFVSNY